MNTKLLTTAEIADLLRVHPVTVRLWARRSVVRALWVGSSWRFVLPDVLEDLAARRAPGRTP